MLDIKYVVENTQAVKQALAGRNGEFPVDKAVELELKRRETIKEVETLKARRNSESAKVAQLKREKKNADDIIADMQKTGVRIKELDDILSSTEAELKELMLSIPNIPHSTTPFGKSDADNVEVRKWGEPTSFDFSPKPHWELGEALNLLDWPRAAKISGARFTVCRGAAARLERSVISLMLDLHTSNGYTEILPPYIVNRASMTATGQLPKFEEDAFALKNTDYFLIPTAEVPVTNLHRDEILSEDALPIKYCAYTACFRAEAGSAGRDTRGLIRQHQFDKVELVKFTRPSESYEELEKLTAAFYRRYRLFVGKDLRPRSVDAKLRQICGNFKLLQFRGLSGAAGQHQIQTGGNRQARFCPYLERQRFGGRKNGRRHHGKLPEPRRHNHRTGSVEKLHGLRHDKKTIILRRLI